MNKLQILLVSTVFSLAIAVPANALTDFKFVKKFDKASAKLPTRLIASDITPTTFDLKNIVLDFNGVSGQYTLRFYVDGLGGFSAIDPTGKYVIDISSEVLFTGPTSMPTFKDGSFATRQRDASSLDTGVLTIATVPEPRGWATLTVGFGLTGAMIRQRRLVSKTSV